MMVKTRVWFLVACAVLSGTELGAYTPPQAGDGRAPVTAAHCAALAGGTAGDSAGCLPKEKVDTIERAFRGPVDSDGRPLFAPRTYDAGVGDPGWVVWQTGQLTGRVDETISRYFSFPPITPEELERLDYVRAYERMATTTEITDATATDFSTFRARGGKVLIATGWSDPIFAPNDLVRWYEKLDADTRATGGGTCAAEFARLFLVPGMTHCGGGLRGREICLGMKRGSRT